MRDLRLRSDAVDDQLDALADPERRRLLFALLDAQPDEDVLGRLADGARPGRDLDYRTAMRHFHLPKLDDLGFVDWDRERGAVERGPEFDRLRPFLELLASDRAPLLLAEGEP